MSKNSKITPKRPVSSCSSISSDGLEHHKIQTEDGYILSLFRVIKVGGKNASSEFIEKCEEKEEKAVPVLLITGLFNGGTEWLEKEEEENLPNILLKQSYDCWMGCVRGTPHSRTHTTLKNTSRKYWDFSIDEMSKFDIPAIIDYILKVTKSNELAYVGYSLGGAMIFATLNLKPEYTKKISIIIGLAPACYGKHFGTIWNKMFIPVAASARRIPFLYSRSVGSKPLANNLKKFIPIVKKEQRTKFGGWLAKRVATMAGTVVSGCRTERKMFNRIAEVMPASTSMKHVSHIAQCFNDGKFRAFNYSRSGNIKRYGQAKPPMYDLSKITVPVVTFTAAHDRLVPPVDVERTANSLPNLISHHNVSSLKFSHCDFLFGKDADTLVYDKIVQILNTFLSSNTSN